MWRWALMPKDWGSAIWRGRCLAPTSQSQLYCRPPIGKALDLILVEMRKCGKYTEEEIKASCPKWALVSRHGEHVMTRCKDETLASKVCYEEIRPNTPHDPEQPPAQRRRINWDVTWCQATHAHGRFFECLREQVHASCACIWTWDESGKIRNSRTCFSLCFPMACILPIFQWLAKWS